MSEVDFDNEVKRLMLAISNARQNTVYVEKRLACHYRQENSSKFDFDSENNACYRISYFDDDDEVISRTGIEKEQVIPILEEILRLQTSFRSLFKSKVGDVLDEIAADNLNKQQAMNLIVAHIKELATFDDE